jgi:hypothetical protein
MRRLALVLVLTLIAAPALAAPRITDPAVRAFVARQERAWNAGELDIYFAAFTPQARFTDQAYVGDKPPVLYGVSTRAEAKAQAKKARARGGSREAARIGRIAIAADGQSATVRMIVGSHVVQGGRARRMCASRTLDITLKGGVLKGGDQTDTYVKCRGG